jgi:RNA polymerase sigma-70 factor (ECF subfamily)
MVSGRDPSIIMRPEITSSSRSLSPLHGHFSYNIADALCDDRGDCPAVNNQDILRRPRRHEETAVDTSRKSNETLFQDVQAGGCDAFAILVERYQRRAFGVALRILRRRQDAEDAVQHAFLRAFEARLQYSSRWRFSTWFYRILINACVDELHHRRPLRWLRDQAQVSADRPDHRLERAEQDHILHGALEAVPVQARIVLTLYYGDGRSYREIGAIRGVSVHTVKTHLRRGRLALRKALRARGVDAS